MSGSAFLLWLFCVIFEFLENFEFTKGFINAKSSLFSLSETFNVFRIVVHIEVLL